MLCYYFALLISCDCLFVGLGGFELLALVRLLLAFKVMAIRVAVWRLSDCLLCWLWVGMVWISMGVVVISACGFWCFSDVW